MRECGQAQLGVLLQLLLKAREKRGWGRGDDSQIWRKRNGGHRVGREKKTSLVSFFSSCVGARLSSSFAPALPDLSPCYD